MVTEHRISVPLLHVDLAAPSSAGGSITVVDRVSSGFDTIGSFDDRPTIDVYFAVIELITNSESDESYLASMSNPDLDPRKRAEAYLFRRGGSSGSVPASSSSFDPSRSVIYLQGGPGFGCAPPVSGLSLASSKSSWASAALLGDISNLDGSSFDRVVLMDQRGTGRSSPISRRSLGRMFPDLFLLDDDDDDDDGNGGGPMTSSSSSSPSDEVVDLRELRRLRRSRVRLHYSSGSYHGSPSSWSAYALCRQLRFGDVPDLLWLACVGVTDAYLHGRLDVAGYSALSVDLRRHVGRLFPNDAVDRAGRAVYAEELEDDGGGGGGGRALTMIGLSENGRILFQDEYKFMLLRHTSLWDSMLHSNYVASKLQVWKSAGRRRLMELLAKMGFPLDQCRQPWAFVGPGMRRRLGERLGDCTEVRRDGHDARARACTHPLSLKQKRLSTFFLTKRPRPTPSVFECRNTDWRMYRTRDSSASPATSPSSPRATCPTP